MRSGLVLRILGLVTNDPFTLNRDICDPEEHQEDNSDARTGIYRVDSETFGAAISVIYSCFVHAHSTLSEDVLTTLCI